MLMTQTIITIKGPERVSKAEALRMRAMMTSQVAHRALLWRYSGITTWGQSHAVLTDTNN